MLESEVASKGKKAKKAAEVLANLSSEKKNKALLGIAVALLNEAENILQANEIDLSNLVASQNHTQAFYDRLQLTPARIEDMAMGIHEIIDLDDPIGEVTSMWKRPNGLQIGKVKVPLGVIGIIYEARPNVTVDATALSLKTGNAVILRGSSEAINSNRALVKVIRNALAHTEVPVDAVSLIEDISRESAIELMQQKEYLDVLIPRGGRGLIQSVVKNSQVPVIETGEGNCHTYIDAVADINMAKEIAVNAKTHRPGVCNAMETLLVHADIAPKCLAGILQEMVKRGVEIRGCARTKEIFSEVILATEKDWETEYLDMILAVKVVHSLGEAIDHINKYGSGHSEAIVTNSYQNSREFLAKIDAAAVYINASTRFTDGYEFGLGAEMGISTQKLHVRGPMGLEALTSTKLIIYGEGQVR